MPTYERLPRFAKDWEKLTAAERAQFRTAVREFIDALKAGSGRYPPGLRVHRIGSTDDVWSLTWAPDGRATFQFGESINEAEPHVIWRRIGSHQVYKRP